MMPLLKFAAESLLCLAEHINSIPAWFLTNRKFMRLGVLVVYDVTDSENAILSMRKLANDSMPRLMDHFFLWTPNGMKENRQLMMDELFNESASDFTLLINEDNNRQNINNLFKFILDRFNDRGHLDVLDFGCGSGLSVEVAKKFKLSLSGYDRCANMRALSASMGLNVIDPEVFEGVTCPTYDAIIASYVFHLTPSFSDLSHLWRILKPHGIIVANFHKGCGVTEIDEHFVNLGAAMKELSDPSFDHFGVYHAYVRN